jgi:formylglycine-generating enzyme required for sulfatase activity
LRAARGASWNQENLLGRCAARTGLAPYFRVNDFGIRWVIGPRLE